nr:response regulator [Elusimicrobiota bacterium]
DIDMPEMDGFEVLKRVKNNPATKIIPVIMLTARSAGADFEKAINSDADRYVAKPFKTKFLLEKIRQLL